MTEPAVANLQISANLIEHYLYIKDAPISPGPSGRFVSVFDGSLSHLLTVDSSGQMMHFMQDQTSQSGWSVDTVNIPVPSGSQGMFSLTAFYASGSLQVIALFAVGGGYAATWVTRTGAGQWPQVPMSFAASSLLSLVSQVGSYIDGTGESGVPYVFGRVPPCLGAIHTSLAYQNSAQFFLLYFDVANQLWDVLFQTATETLDPYLAPSHFHIVASQDSEATGTLILYDGVTAYFCPFAVGQNHSVDWLTQNNSQLNLPTGEALKTMIPFPGGTWLDSCILLSQSGKAIAVSPDEFILLPLPGEKGIEALTISQCPGQLVMFAVEKANGALWIARQQGQSKNLPQFGSWVSLGDTVDAFAAPATTSGGPEVYFADLNNLNVYHLAQNLTDGIWSSKALAAPTDPTGATMTPVSGIMMEVRALDANGVLAGNQVLQIASDQWANVIVNEFCYTPGPGSPVSIKIDLTGVASVFYHATSLAMPIFTFSIGNVSNTCQGDTVATTTTPVNPSSVANRLANKDASLPCTVSGLSSPAAPRMPLIPASTDPSYVSYINTLGQQMATTPLTLAGARFLAGAGQASSALAPAADFSEANLSFGWSDIGDLVHDFTHDVDKIASVAVTVVEDGLQIVINGVAKLLTSVRQMAAVVQMIFVKIKNITQDVYDFIQAVIQFLELLFDWDDILKTHEILKAFVRSFLAAAGSSQSDLRSMIGSTIADLQQNIDAAYASVQAKLGSASGNQFANSNLPLPPTPPGALSSATNAIDGKMGSDKYQQNLSRCQYIFHQAKNHLSLPSAAAAPASSGIDLSTIEAQVKAAWDSSIMNNTQLTNFLAPFTEIPSGGNILDVSMSKILAAGNVLTLLALDGLELVVTAIFDVIADVLSALQDILDPANAIYIPVVSWLYKNIITDGDTLSLLDLLCLVFAVPITILYKLLYDDKAPFTSEDVSHFQTNQPAWPLSRLAASAARPAAMPGSLGSNYSPAVAYMTIGTCAALLNLINGGVSAISDALVLAVANNDIGPEDAPVVAISWISVLGSTLDQVAGAPWSSWVESGDWSAGDTCDTIYWAASTLPIFYQFAFTIASNQLADFSDSGIALDTGVGAALGGVGLLCVFEGDVDWDNVANNLNMLLTPLEKLSRFLLFSKDNEEVAPIAFPLLIGADLVLGYGTMVTELLSSVYSWSHQA